MSELIIHDSNHLKAELDIQISTSKAYPRNVKSFLSEAIALVTLNEETAASCIYSVPRGTGNEKKFITGESIRLAEIVASAWGNLHAGSRIVENDGKTITAEGVSWDLEKNVKITKQVKRSIRTKDGRPYSQDMQVVTSQAAQSIALRNAILGNIPRAFTKEVYNAAVKFSIGDPNKLQSKIDTIIERFSNMGIEKERIFSYFGYGKEKFTQQDVEEMIGIGTAIKDGALSIDDAFIVIMEKNKATELNERLNN